MLLKLASGAPPCCNVRCGFPLQIRHHNIYLQTNLKSLPFPCNLSCPGISKDSSKMSAPAASRQLSAGRDIPSKRVTVNDPSQLPQDYSTTPGGTLFSTTPGGTRIIYDRHFLLNMRNSPLSQTPPKNLPSIPGVTCPVEGSTAEKPNGEHKVPTSKADAPEDQFQMDI